MPITLGSRRLSAVALFGVCACALALVAMVWGELSARNQRQAIDATLEAIVDRGDRGLDPADDGRMVRIVGRPMIAGPVTDDDTGFSAAALVLEREVEMWQDFQFLRRPGDRSGPDLRWSSIRIPIWSLEDRDRPGRDNPEFPFIGRSFVNPTARIGDVPVDAGLARDGGFDRRVVSADALPALMHRLPDLRPSLDGDWVVLAAEPTGRHIGDLRVRYETRVGDDRMVTAIGRQREGRLVREVSDLMPSAVLSGDKPPEAFLGYGVLDGPSDAQMWGRGGGVVILAAAVAFIFLGGFKKSDPDAGSFPGSGALGLLPGPVLLGGLALVLLPFAVMALPAAIGLGLLAHWMAQGWIAMLTGTVAALAVAAAVLFATAGRLDAPPAPKRRDLDEPDW